MTSFSDLLQRRQSVRHYDARPVEAEKLQALIEAVRLAPSACNSQPWALILVTDPALKDQVARAAMLPTSSLNRWAVEAPVIAVLTLEPPTLSSKLGGLMKKREFPLIDIGVAGAQLCLQAAELGLGTCMLGWFDEQRIQTLLHIPRRIRIGLLITVGYAAEDCPPRRKVRKTVAEMSRWNDYRQNNTT